MEVKIEETEIIIQVTDEFLDVCQEIRDRELSIEEWRLIESSDMFQCLNFSGGFEEAEDTFCFSYYDKEGKEFFFQIDL